MPTVLGFHIPLVSSYPERRGTQTEKVPWWVIRNAGEVLDLQARYPVPLVLQGHLHENERLVHPKWSTESARTMIHEGQLTACASGSVPILVSQVRLTR